MFTISVETQVEVVQVPLNNTNLKLLDSCSVYRLIHREVTLVTQWLQSFRCRQLFYTKDNRVYVIKSNEINILYLEDFDNLFQTLLNNHEIPNKPMDKKAAHFYTVLYAWTLGSPALEKSLLKLNIPKEFKIVSSQFLYRGIRLHPSSVERLLNGKSVKLKPRKCTSWTTLPNIAKGFCRNGPGCVVKCPTKQLPIFVNIKKALGGLQVFDEREIIVLGNGLDEITNDNIYWRNWKNSEEIREQIGTNGFTVTKRYIKIDDSLYKGRELAHIKTVASFKKYLAHPMYYLKDNRQITIDKYGIALNKFILVNDNTVLETRYGYLVKIQNIGAIVETLVSNKLLDTCSTDEASAVLLSSALNLIIDAGKSTQQYLLSLNIPEEYRTVAFNPVYMKLNGLSDKAKLSLSNKKPLKFSDIKSVSKRKAEEIFEMNNSGEEYANNSAVVSFTLDVQNVFLNPAITRSDNYFCKNTMFVKPFTLTNYKVIAKNY